MRGHIRKRGRSWTSVIYVGRDLQTKNPRQIWNTHKSKREAEAHVAEILSQIQSGRWSPPTKVRVGDFLERWLHDYAEGAVQATTLKSYREIIRQHIIPALGYILLTLLSPQIIQSYYSRKLGESLSSTTVRRHHAIIREALGHAVRWGLLGRNPATLTNAPKPQRFEAQIWDEEQVRLFLAVAKRSSDYYALYLTAVLTGMRQGELLGLRWRDVNFAVSVASIHQTFYRLGREKLFKQPKSQASRRAIALPPAVVTVLRGLKEGQEENRRFMGGDYCDHDLVFCQANGRPLHAGNIVRRDFRQVTKRAKIPPIRFHDLRHAHASYLARAGVPAKVVQERLGHSTLSFTMKVYTHTLAGQQEAAAIALEHHLLGKLSQEISSD